MPTIVLLGILALTPLRLFGAGMAYTSNIPPSSFPARLKQYAAEQPLEKGYIDVTKPPYSAAGNGASDDSEAIQNAVDDAYANNLLVFFPADATYLVSRKIACIGKKKGDRKFAHQLIGASEGSAPIIKLADGSRVDGNVLFNFDLLDEKSGTSASASLYCTALRRIQIDMGDNPAQNAVTMSGAQHCLIEDVSIYGNFNVGISNMPGSGGSMVNITITGGKIGILQDEYRPDPVIVGLKLANQSDCGIKILNSRGPVVMAGFSIVSPENPSPGHRAIHAESTAPKTVGSNLDHGNGNLLLADGTIEVKANGGLSVYNYAQDVTMTNVYVKAAW